MKKLLLILMMVSFAGLNNANAAHIDGAGAISCGEVISEYKKSYVVELGLINWMQGFISGMNLKLESQKGKNNDANAIFYAVMNRCHEKPLDLFAQAVHFVYNNELTE